MAVEDGPGSVPGVEDRHDGQAHLLARVGGEVLAGLLVDDALERLHEPLQLARVEVGVLALALQRVERVLEQVAVDPEHRLAEHLDEPPVRVPREAVVAARLLGQAVHRLVVEPDVENGLHHARHGELRPGAHAHQQRVVGLPEPPAHLLLERVEVLGDLLLEAVRYDARRQVVTAGVGGDRESRGNGEPEVGHFGKVRSLAAKKILEIPVALGEVVNVLGHHTLQSTPLPGLYRRN
jgi:hypothetical protein